MAQLDNDKTSKLTRTSLPFGKRERERRLVSRCFVIAGNLAGRTAICQNPVCIVHSGEASPNITRYTLSTSTLRKCLGHLARRVRANGQTEQRIAIRAREMMLL